MPTPWITTVRHDYYLLELEGFGFLDFGFLGFGFGFGFFGFLGFL